MASPIRKSLIGFVLAGLVGCARPEPSLVPLSVGTELRAEPRTGERARDRTAHASAADEETPAPGAPDDEDGERGSPEDEKEVATSKDTTTPAGGEAKADAPGETAAVTWEGEYVGEDVSTYRFAGAERAEHDPKAKTRVHDQTPDTVKLTLVSSADGSDLCTLSAKVKDRAATLEAGQECFSSSQGPVTMRGVVQSGTATLTDDRLVLEATLTFEVLAESQQQLGELAYRFEGRRR